jgi:hypothetical protein
MSGCLKNKKQSDRVVKKRKNDMKLKLPDKTMKLIGANFMFDVLDCQ